MTRGEWMLVLVVVAVIGSAIWRSRQAKEKNQRRKDAKPEKETPAKREEETLYATFREAERQRGSRRSKAREYFQKATNWVALLTLLFVIGYTSISGAQLFLARRSEVHQLRAYVRVSPENTPSFNTVIDYDVVATFKNVGQTPAKNAQGFIMVRRAAWPLPDKFDYEIGDLSPKITEMPSLDHTLNKKVSPASTDEENLLLDEQGALVVYGTVFYDDVFGWSRWTDFCYAYTWKSLAEKRVEYCAAHNDAY